MMLLLRFLVLLTSADASHLPASVWSTDFESGTSGFISYGDTDQWAWGISTNSPSACHSGAYCFDTVLNGEYLNASTDYLGLPAVDLSSLERPLLVFYQWYFIDGGDAGSIEIWRGSDWTLVEPVYGYPTENGFSGESYTWIPAYVSLAGVSSLDQVRLVFRSDERGTLPGWTVDDFAVYDEDIVPPNVAAVTHLPDTDDLAGPYLVNASVSDDFDVYGVVLRYDVDLGPVRETPMTTSGDGTWTGEIPGQAKGSVVRYQVIATDGTNTSIEPDPGFSFRVLLFPPSGLQTPDAVAWGTTVPLTWIEPSATHPIVSYRVYRDDLAVDEVTEPEAHAPMRQGDQSFSVAALYDVGESEPCEPISVDGAVPSITSLKPDEGYQGDTLRLLLTGYNLLLTPATITVSLGQGTQVDDVAVRDADSAYVSIQVDDDALPGARDLVISTNGVAVFSAAAFDVLDGADRPHLESVEPSFVEQGDSTSLVIQSSEPFKAPPVVHLGDDIVVEDVVLDGTNAIEVSIVVPYTVPIGERTVEVDDGTRILTGVSLEVRNKVTAVDTCQCGSGGRSPWGSSWPLTLVAAAAGLRRRRLCPETRSGRS
jgi:hypothetical protein